MKLSVSNIAWNVEQDLQIAELLKHHGVTHIDIAPGKYFKDLPATSDLEISQVKAKWSDLGISCAGMQSLLFGTKGLNLFERSTQIPMLAHLEKICHIGAVLGADKLVFGSPKNRDRSGLSDDETQDLALDFFQRLGNTAKCEGVIINLEANPTCYGTNFLTNTQEAAEFVKTLNHPAIRLQLDLGTVYTNHEDIESLLNRYAAIIGHIHLSEPQMAPLSASDEEHAIVGKSLIQAIRNHKLNTNIASIEMLTNQAKDEFEQLRQLSKAIVISRTLYGIEA